MINILVVHRDINYSVKLLNNICTRNSNIRITNIARSIEDMYKLINSNYFDIILIDLHLLISTKLDSCFRNFMKHSQESIIILGDNNIQTKKFSKFTCIVKDNFDDLAKEIIELSSITSDNQNIRNRIKEELSYLGYSYNHLGTTYLADIIYLVYCTDFDGSLEQGIYPYIAQKYNKTINTIKCDIINATNLMYCDCPKEKLTNYLGKCSYFKPGPKTIIYTVINKVS